MWAMTGFRSYGGEGSGSNYTMNNALRYYWRHDVYIFIIIISFLHLSTIHIIWIFTSRSPHYELTRQLTLV